MQNTKTKQWCANTRWWILGVNIVGILFSLGNGYREAPQTSRSCGTLTRAFTRQQGILKVKDMFTLCHFLRWAILTSDDSTANALTNANTLLCLCMYMLMTGSLRWAKKYDDVAHLRFLFSQHIYYSYSSFTCTLWLNWFVSARNSRNECWRKCHVQWIHSTVCWKWTKKMASGEQNLNMHISLLVLVINETVFEE